MPQYALSQYPKILVVRLDHIGDVVLNVPLLRGLRAAAPHAMITLVVRQECQNLMDLCPYVNKVVGISIHKKAYSVLALWSAWNKKNFFKNEKFDLVINPRWDADYYEAGKLISLNRSRLRLAYSETVSINKSFSDRGYDRFYTQVVSSIRPASSHEIHKNLDFLKHLGVIAEDTQLELWASKEDERFLRAKLCACGVVQGREMLVLCPFAGQANREWPLENYIKLIRRLNAQHPDLIYIVLGDKKKRKIAEGIIPYIRRKVGKNIWNLVGELTLREVYLLMKEATLVIGSDSGPAHIAAAANSNLVVISNHPVEGSSDSPHSPKRFGPWCKNKSILQPALGLDECVEECIDCQAHCILKVSVDEVAKAAEFWLSKRTKL